MSRMRQVTHHSTVDHESNLDALLEDLQTTVSRSNSQLNLNGTVTSGYREIRRTVTDGTPQGTMSEYQIEYVNPANSSHHMIESNHSYNASPSQRQVYKESSYNFNTSSTEHNSGRTDAKLKQNISELDSLLDDLNTAQKRSFSETSNTALTRHTGGIDSGLLEPVRTSTPSSGGRLMEEKHYREVVRERSSSPRRELVFTGPRSRDPSPITPVRQQQFYRYEKTTTSRTTGPVMTDMTPDSSQVLRSNNNLAIEESGLRNRSPSPGGNRIEYHYSNTTASTQNRDNTPHFPVSKYREPHDSREYSPQRYTSGKTTNSYSYSTSSSTRESRSEVPRSPPPHRSPSPVSFNAPPGPTTPKGPYAYDPPPPPRSPQPHRFSPQQSPHQQHSTYKYTATTTTTKTGNFHNTDRQVYPEEQPLLPRPFPSPSPTPQTPDQQPPKKLDELMAAFSDTTEFRNRRNETVHSSHHRYDRDIRETEKLNQSLIPNGHGKEHIVEKEKEKQIVKKEESKNIEGPPVYYPPGVELFSKKEESMAQQQSGGGMYKAKAKYEYESKSKSKSKESSGKAVVPVCLPVCCAMPCTIM